MLKYYGEGIVESKCRKCSYAWQWKDWSYLYALVIIIKVHYKCYKDKYFDSILLHTIDFYYLFKSYNAESQVDAGQMQPWGADSTADRQAGF